MTHASIYQSQFFFYCLALTNRRSEFIMQYNVFQVHTHQTSTKSNERKIIHKEIVKRKRKMLCGNSRYRYWFSEKKNEIKWAKRRKKKTAKIVMNSFFSCKQQRLCRCHRCEKWNKRNSLRMNHLENCAGGKRCRLHGQMWKRLGF